jgi:YegS/Rv2252/BmrU family lipid kinase
VKKKIAFVVRGNLRHPHRFRTETQSIFGQHYDVILKFTRRIGHATEIVKELLLHKTDYIIGVGGDGTFSEVVNGYMQASFEHRAHTILAPLPRGAGNDFARTAGRIESLTHLHQLIQENKQQKMDVVQISYQDVNGKIQYRFFNNSFDIGLGGIVCQHVNRSSKNLGSNFTYLYNIVRSFIKFRHIPVHIKSPDFNFTGKVLLAAITNGQYFGSGLCISPEAEIDDGKVNVFIARKVSLLHFLRYLPALKQGKKINHPEVFYGSLSQCSIESPSMDHPLEMDGEVAGQLPLDLKVIKHAATILKT